LALLYCAYAEGNVEESREAKRGEAVKWQSCESVKTALGDVETGFVDLMRNEKWLKNGILMHKIYNLRLRNVL